MHTAFQERAVHSQDQLPPTTFLIQEMFKDRKFLFGRAQPRPQDVAAFYTKLSWIRKTKFLHCLPKEERVQICYWKYISNQ